MQTVALLNNTVIKGIKKLALTLFLSSLFFLQQDVVAEGSYDKLNSLISKLSYKHKIAVSVVDLKSSRKLFGFNDSQPLKPASVLKILTSIAALKILGPEYKFSTTLLRSGDSFFVRGGGDPDFTTETMWILARSFKKLGIKKIERLGFDDSAFIAAAARAGERAYESSPSALAFNYDSFAIETCPGKPGQPAIVTNDPWELPIEITSTVITSTRSATNIAIEERQPHNTLAKQSFAVSGTIAEDDKCRSLYRSISNPAEYFAYSMKGFLQALGFAVPDRLAFGKTPQNYEAIHEVSSKSLALILQDLNHFSTNFIAEQIVYILGEAREDPPRYDRQLGLEKIKNFFAENAGTDEFEIIDGSGLSHKNRISVRSLTKLLSYAHLDQTIRADFEASLSVAGRNGTLKRRKLNYNRAVVRGKTGSLDGVSSLAGYIYKINGEQLAFAIIQNEISSKESAMNVEDEIVEAISGI